MSHKLIGLVEPSGRILAEDGKRLWSPASAPDNMALFAARKLNDPDEEIYWQASRRTAYLHGRTIRYLFDTFRDQTTLPSNEATLEGLATWRDWLESYNVNIAQGARRITNDLWHRTSTNRKLPRIDTQEIYIHLGARLYRPNMFYIEEGESWLWDLSGAYAWSSSVCHYPEEGWNPEQKWSGDPLAYVYAAISMPAKQAKLPGSLPEPRPVPHGAPFDIDIDAYKQRRPYRAKVLLLGAELAAIRPHIEPVDIILSYEPQGKLRPLCRPAWIDAVETGRALPGVASRMAKRTANALWGSFAASGGYKRVNYRTGVFSDKIGNMRPRSLPIAGIIVAQVRMRVWTEALTAAPVIVSHTDSAIVPSGYGPDGPRGTKLGEWRITERMYDLQCFGVQTRRYRTKPGGPWHYVFAGERDHNARRSFGGKLRRYIDPALDDPRIGLTGWHRWR